MENLSDVDAAVDPAGMGGGRTIIRRAGARMLRPVLLGLVSITLQIGCDESGSSKIPVPFGGSDPRDLTYAEWKREREAGRGDSLARQLTPDEIEAISAGIISHKGDSAAVAVLTMRELIELGRNVKNGTTSPARTQ